uniref:Si:dkey-211g8.9 n=1 Tax=Neogobius melanostomus TaxID=47308 RepID=A0A8C6UUH1_9GOBI
MHSGLLPAGYILTFVLGIPSNILALCTFCRKVSRKATPIDVLLLNLTVSDLIFLAFLPFKIKEALDNMTWSLPFCTLLLTAVAVERYLGVAFPLRYSLWRRPRYAVLASVIFWIITLTNLSIVYIMPTAKIQNGSTPAFCYLKFTPEELSVVLPVRLELFLVLFCVPFFICTFCYVNFILILSRLPNISRRRRLRAIGLALGTLLVFAVCFGPYNVSHVVGFARKESEDWRNVALLSSTLNACLDPIIFYFSSAAVRGMLKRCCQSIMAKIALCVTCSTPGPGGVWV